MGSHMQWQTWLAGDALRTLCIAHPTFTLPSPSFTLQPTHRVPVAVIDDAGVSHSQGDALPTSTG